MKKEYNKPTIRTRKKSIGILNYFFIIEGLENYSKFYENFNILDLFKGKE